MKYLGFFFLILSSSLFSQTIAEKKQSFEQGMTESAGEVEELLTSFNEILLEKRKKLKTLYEQAHLLHAKKAEEKSYQHLLKQIQELKQLIASVQEACRQETVSSLLEPPYALWHQPDTTLMQFIIDYASQEYLYFMPPEIANIPLSISSSMPMPQENCEECLTWILSQQGIGIRQINPYLRELYLLHQDLTKIQKITDNPEELMCLPETSRLCFLFPVDSLDPKKTLQFLKKFSNPLHTSVEFFQGKIFLVSTVEVIQELLKIYEFAKKEGGGQEFQLVTLNKIDALEMQRVLNTIFSLESPEEGSSLQVIPLAGLAHSLCLSGSGEEVKKILQFISEFESQIENPQEKTLFWYTAKHSEAEELAKLLSKVYEPLLRENHIAADTVSPEKSQNNFIVDPKTGSLIMVVEQKVLPQIKELLKKIDIPKKMVQIEVLLFEKKITNQNKSGLNLLRLGQQASQSHLQGLSWSCASGTGIFEFLFSRSKESGIPAYDLAYNFLLTQNDISINASPSVTTMNQTPATIAIVEEISIDAGSDDKQRHLFNRAQYGITMQMTPTISTADEEGISHITLETDITFDTTEKNSNDRPDVTRRHIKNHVRIPDGQTVIIGGLRRKSTNDTKDSIPFLGEIPGLGKLFSTTNLCDSHTEMFVFITPHILEEPFENMQNAKQQLLQKRPGDTPEFLTELLQAKNTEKKRLFEGGLSLLLGRQNEKALPLQEHPKGEYDGK